MLLNFVGGKGIKKQGNTSKYYIHNIFLLDGKLMNEDLNKKKKKKLDACDVLVTPKSME